MIETGMEYKYDFLDEPPLFIIDDDEEYELHCYNPKFEGDCPDDCKEGKFCGLDDCNNMISCTQYPQHDEPHFKHGKVEICVWCQLRIGKGR